MVYWVLYPKIHWEIIISLFKCHNLGIYKAFSDIPWKIPMNSRFFLVSYHDVIGHLQCFDRASNEAAWAIPAAATIATVGRGELRRAMSAEWVPHWVRNYWLFTGALYRLMIWNLEFGCYHVTSPWIFLEGGRSPLLCGWNRSNIGYILFWFLCFQWNTPLTIETISNIHWIYIWIATCKRIQDIEEYQLSSFIRLV